MNTLEIMLSEDEMRMLLWSDGGLSDKNVDNYDMAEYN